MPPTPYRRVRGGARQRAALLGRGLGDAVAGVALRVDVRRVALLGATVIALLGGLGTVVGAGTDLPLFDLDGEGNVPAAWSGLLFLTAALLALALAHRADVPGVRPRAPAVLAGVFAWMALDEVFVVHEHLDDAIGIDWQLLYVPILAAATWGWTGVWRIARALGRAWIPWLGGMLAWALASFLELLTFDGVIRQGSISTFGDYRRRYHTLGYQLEAIPEELLEMTGGLAFVLALLVMLRRGRDRAGRATTVHFPAAL